MRVLVSGDRHWTNRKVIYDVLSQLDKDSVIIHGAARGADSIAAECALELGLRIEPPPTPGRRLGGRPAQWTVYHRGAGPVRNSEMIKLDKPDVVFGFHDYIWDSKGTRNCVEQAIKAQLPVYVFTEDGCKHRATWEPNLQDIELHFESFGPGVLHKYPNHYGHPVGHSELEDAKQRLTQRNFVYDDDYLDTIYAKLNLPKHHGTCDCATCNTAYGPRHTKDT